MQVKIENFYLSYNSLILILVPHMFRADVAACLK
jgi:hypothetical protein